jgi:integrase
MLRCVGRKRTSDKHLPWRMYRHGAGYRFLPPHGKAVALGTDYPTALHKYAKIIGPYREGSRPLETLGDVIDRYAREVVPTKAPTTQATNEYELRLLKRVFGEMAPADLLPEHVYGYMDQRPATRANREIALLSHVLRHAIRWGLLRTNPCREVIRHKESPRERYVSDGEFWQVHERASPVLRIAMLLCASCGLRGSELLRLRWEQCRADGIHIQRGKGGRRQILRYNETVSEALAAARARLRRGDVTVVSPWVLPRRDGRQYTASGFSTLWQRLGAGFQLRDLRAKSGSDHATGDHLGHQSRRTLDRHYRRRPVAVEVVDISKTTPSITMPAEAEGPKKP